MDRDEQVCPVCGQPVRTAARRYKTLGVWVPVWGPGPCRNRACEAYAGGGAVPADEPGTATGSPAGSASGPAPGVPAGVATDPATGPATRPATDPVTGRATGPAGRTSRHAEGP
ncbi:hypothetical protein ACFV5G_39555 [Streptomyces sp. NPDC059766]|uniref:hypothetical protein n=1 Tax=Streptomyces sp. NPDC059766 TaxID=3346940 RepID=UPI00364B1C90